VTDSRNTDVPQDAKRWAQLKSDILEAATSLGIDSIGFASADPFTTLKDRLIAHRAKGHESGFEEKDLDKRTTPALLFDRPKSIIAIAVAYPTKLVDPPKSEPGAYRGILARSSWGRDYHHVLRDRLKRLEAFIAERVPEARMESMVDTGALSDRAVAERAGIGWSAKNCSIISPKLGSWIYLGEMITNIPFEPDTPVTEGCGECTKCIDACPTNALVGPGQLNAQRCISFLTQTKGVLSEEFMTKIGNRLYGCDTCQIVCPENRGKNWTQHPEMQPDPEIVKPLLIPLLSMSNKEYKEKYGDNSSSWRGKKPIQRNAIIALGNFKDVTAVPHLHTLMKEDPRPELRTTAAWALGKIGGQASMDVLKDMLRREADSAVIAAIGEARAKLGQHTTPLLYSEMDSPIGPLTLVRSIQGLCRIEFGAFEDQEASILEWASRWYADPELIANHAAMKDIVVQLQQFFAGERKSFDLPLDMKGTPFQLQVWQALTEVPYGETWSYKQIAEWIDQPKAVRAVGGANNKNPVSVIVPCHRVIGMNGKLVGYGGGLDKKQILLALEQQHTDLPFVSK